MISIDRLPVGRSVGTVMPGEVTFSAADVGALPIGGGTLSGTLRGTAAHFSEITTDALQATGITTDALQATVGSLETLDVGEFSGGEATLGELSADALVALQGTIHTLEVDEVSGTTAYLDRLVIGDYTLDAHGLRRA